MNMTRELAALERLTVGELQRRYAEVCGESTASRHRQYLVRRIAWRMQAGAEGGLSERALQRAAGLADPADARVTPPRPPSTTRTARISQEAARTSEAVAHPSDPRLPPVGAALRREYRGRTITVAVLANGFEYEGERFQSLSAVAKAITGSHINGFRFFGLEGKR